MSANGHSLDLSSLGSERLTVKLTPEYEFSLPSDFSTTIMVRLVRALKVIGEAMERDGISIDQVATADAEGMAIVSEIMTKADPQPPQPLATLFTPPMMIRFLNFLGSRFVEALSSTTSSGSSTSSRAGSRSRTSSHPAPSTSQQSE